MAVQNQFKGLMEGVAGVRGIVGKGLNPAIVCRYAAAYGMMIGGGEVVVGLDGRPSGAMIYNAVTAGLQSVGCHVLNIGMVPTPTIQVVIMNRGSNGGVAITASHNPQEWNALKFFAPSSLFLDESEGAELRGILEENSIDFVSWDRLGVENCYEHAIEDHIKCILKIPYLNLAAIRRKDFKVAVDCVNGAGSLIFPELMSELGCTVVKLNCEPSGIFGRGAEPLPENLTELCSLVTESGADLGIAVDPDSDRLAMVDEKGEAIGEEYSLVIAADFVLGNKKGPLVANVSSTRALDDIAEKHGAQLHRTKVGEVHVAKRMASLGAVVGGEGNGGVILPEVHLGRDAPVGAALTLQYLTERETTMSEAVDALPRYQIVKDKVELKNLPAGEAVERTGHWQMDAEIDRTDGVKFIYPRSWIQVRPSNTEPIVRIFAEAEERETAERMCGEMKERILNMDCGD